MLSSEEWLRRMCCLCPCRTCRTYFCPLVGACFGKGDCDDLAAIRAGATSRALGGKGVSFIKASCPEPLPAGVVGDGARSLGDFNSLSSLGGERRSRVSDLCQVQYKRHRASSRLRIRGSLWRARTDIFKE